MADNIEITPGSGATVRTDEVGATQIQVVKIALGADGAEDNLVDSGQQAMAASVPVVIASNQSAVPVSGPLTDTQLRATAVPVSVATIPSHAVTNAGTFAVQVDGAALTALQLLDNIVAGSEAQVDVVASLPAGDNNIGNVDLASAIPAGSNNIGDVDVLTLPAVTLAAAQTLATVTTVTTVGAVTAITNALPAGTNAIGKLAANSGVDIGDVDILSMPALGAGENHLGEIGGKTILATFTLSLDTSAYVSGDVLADTQAVTSALRVNSGTGLLQSIKLLDKDDQGYPLDLYFLNANNSMGTENSAVSVTDANADAILAVVSIAAGDWLDLGGCRIAFIGNLAIPIQAASGTTTLYIAAVSKGTGTYSASGITGILGIVAD